LIDCAIDCKTSDGFIARIFVIAFTKEARDKQSILSFLYVVAHNLSMLKRISSKHDDSHF